MGIVRGELCFLEGYVYVLVLEFVNGFYLEIGFL